MAFPIDITSVKSTWASSEAPVGHSTQHNLIAVLLWSIQTKIGIDSSTDVNSLDYKIRQALTLTWTQDVSNKTLISPLTKGTVDGWIGANEVWTYASASTLTIPGDLTTKYQRWDRFKLTQTTVKYFNVLKVAYATGTTTITITGGTDYTLVNAAISANYYSKQVSPQWWPDWFNYTPTLNWFSVSPTVSYAKFRIIWNTCTQGAAFSGNGTSNAAPLTVNTIGGITAVWEFNGSSWYSVDNGADIASGPYCYIANTASVITCAKALNNTNWTASGGKRSNFSITYQYTL